MVFKTVSRMIQSVNGTAISPGLFHFVEGSIGVCEDITPGIFTVRERNTDAQRHRRQVILRMLEQVIGTTDFAFYKLRHGTVHTGHHDHEFVAAEAADDIHRAEALLQNHCHPFENPIADRMSVSIVDGLEEVNVEEQQRDVRSVLSRAGIEPGQLTSAAFGLTGYGESVTSVEQMRSAVEGRKM